MPASACDTTELPSSYLRRRKLVWSDEVEGLYGGEGAATNDGETTSSTVATIDDGEGGGAGASAVPQDCEDVETSRMSLLRTLLFKNVYFDEEGIENIKKYTYVGCGSTGVDLVLNKWWTFAALHLTPLTVSPNALTLIGLLCSSLALVLVFLTSPRLDDMTHSTVYLVAALLLFLYQTLDAIDGKQARRTGTSSALGQVFDHGCDTFTAVMVSLVGATAAGLGVGYSTLVLILNIQAQLFFFCWWELHFHYFPHASGQLGVTEGQLVVIAVCLARGLGGPSLFMATLPKTTKALHAITSHVGLYLPNTADLTVSKLIFMTAQLIVSTAVISDLLVGIKKVRDKSQALPQLLPCYAYLACEVALYLSPAFRNNPRVGLLLMMAGSSIIALRIHLSAVSKQYFSPNIWPVYPIMLAALCSYALHIESTALQGLLFIWMPLLWCVLYLVSFACSNLTCMAGVLDVALFPDMTKAESEM